MSHATYRPTQSEINNTLWAACDSFRGTLDSSDYKNYILNFMFLKYLSDVWKDRLEHYRTLYNGDETLVLRKMSRERFVLPENCTFDHIRDHKADADLGSLINRVLERIEDENKTKLEGVFRDVDFNSDRLGATKDRNRRLKNLIEDFDKKELNFRPSVIGTEDIIGNAYMYLIEKFASGAGKKGGEFFTPHFVSVLLARLLDPRPGERICDPACGSGSLLITVAEEVPFREGTHLRDCSLYGQESNGGTWALAKMNMFLHGMDGARIEWGDTLNNPRLIEGDHLMRFDVVVANPPFSLDKWGAESASADTHRRYHRGTPPRTKGDYAFITHMVETAAESGGRVGVIVPHGVLFRGGAEGRIREALIRENLLDAVIGLPANLFYGTGIPAAILLFRKGRSEQDVLFVDASRDYEPGKRQNALRDAHIARIVDTHRAYRAGEEAAVEKYAARVPFETLEANDFNLNIPRYVDTFEAEEEVDIPAVRERIAGLEAQLAELKTKMNMHLDELGF